MYPIMQMCHNFLGQFFLDINIFPYLPLQERLQKYADS